MTELQLPAPIHLSLRPHPFDLRRELVEVPAGGTIADMLKIAQPDPTIRRYLRVRLQGELIPPEVWHRVRPKAGTLLEAVPVPQGGNNEMLRTVLMIAIVAGAMALGGWAAGGLVGAGYLAAGGIGFTFASAAIGGALTLAGPLAMALLPPDPVQNPGRITSQEGDR